jgi:hypothetical protein
MGGGDGAGGTHFDPLKGMSRALALEDFLVKTMTLKGCELRNVEDRKAPSDCETDNAGVEARGQRGS